MNEAKIAFWLLGMVVFSVIQDINDEHYTLKRKMRILADVLLGAWLAWLVILL
jgi:hypothetical protein